MKKNFNYKLLAAGASVFLMSASMLYLQGCGSDNDSSTVTTTTANSATTTTVGTATTTTVSGNTGGGGVSTTTNVFLDSIIGDLDYYYIHGSTSTDRSKFLVTFNEMPIAGGTTHLYMLDADSVANATPTLASSGTTYGTVTGDSSGPLDATITFRSTWTQDDSKIMLSGADRFYVINANTLAVENGPEGDNTIAGQNHDALPTTDGKYALLTLRTKPYEGTASEGNMDGEIQLYDVVNGRPVGNPVSVCNGCHGNTRNSTLCGLDGEISLSSGSAPGYGETNGGGTSDTYTGTVYIAGHGAHFAKVDLVIDPSNTTDPIAPLVPYSTLKRVQVAPPGAPATDYWLHDARIDGDTLYWSTYHKDQYGYMHYGAIDMTVDSVTSDTSYGQDCRATGTSVYCASGQTDTHYMPITMTGEGYITVIPKASVTGTTLLTDAPAGCPVTEATNVFMDGIIDDLDYYYIHGSTSTDRSKFLVTFNEMPIAGGTTHLYMLDADSVASATPTLASSGTTYGTVTGDSSGPLDATITFRSTWTQDDSKIMLSGADRFYVINANTLAVENGPEGDNTIAGQNHDALPTTDGKYALLTLRTKPYEGTASEGNMDGEIQLYDVVNGRPVGNPVSVCNGCHGNTRNSTLCGLDGSIVAGGDGTYSGTVYIAGHGAHFAKVDLVIDPSNTTDPIAPLVPYSTLKRVQVAPASSPATDYWLHDARIDGTTLYWSTYHVDANGKVHYGKVDLASGAVTADIAYDVDTKGTGTAIYCASGQTDTHYMPITMTTEGYITAIPKSSIH